MGRKGKKKNKQRLKKNQNEDNDYLTSNGKIDEQQQNAPMTASIHGLYNLGNTCYFNSTLQCLASLVPLVNRQLEDRMGGRSFESLLIGFLQRMNGLVVRGGEERGSNFHQGGHGGGKKKKKKKNKTKGRGGGLCPDMVLGRVRKHHSQFKGGSQQDSHEVMMFD